MLQFVPITVGFTSGAICKYDNSVQVKGAPPSIVFTLAWIFNYLAIGYCWSKDRSRDWIYIANVLLSSLWLYFYNCKQDKKAALYCLLGFLLTLMLAYSTATGTNCKMLLSCVIVWSIFATMLNYQSLEDAS